MLDDHRERVARRPEGRERDEQGMVALLPGLVIVLAHRGQALGAADPAHLRGAGLAGQRDLGIAEAGLAGGAALAVDHLVHALPDEPERPVRDAERGRRLRSLAGVGGRIGAHQPRPDRPAAVGDPRRHHRQLQRRRLHVALADPGDQRLPELPGHAARGLLPRPVGHQPGTLARQIDRERLAEPEPARHRRDRIDADAPGEVVEVDVAGLGDAVDQLQPAVTPTLPAVELVVAELNGAVAGDFVVRPGHAALEGRERGQQLERRARRVLAADRLVDQGRVGAARELAPGVLGEAVGERARVEGRHRGERQHVPGLDVEDHDRSALLGAQPLVDIALQVEVDGEVEVATGLAVGAVQLLDLAAERVDLEPADPGTAAQDRVVDLLDAVLADPEVRQLQQRIAVQLGFRDRPDIAQDMGHDRAGRVVAQQAGIQAHARQVGGVDRDPRQLGPVEVLLDRDRHEPAAPGGFGDHLLEVLLRQRDEAGQRLEGRAQVRGLLAGHEHAIGRAVARDRHPVAVEDPAAGRRQEAMIDPVLVGEQRVFVGADHLQVVEPRREQTEQAELARPEAERAAREGAQAVAFTMHGAPSGSGCAGG